MATQSIPSAIPLVASGGEGAIYAHGAHLISWIPTDSAPVIWMSSLARFEPGIAIRGGVPIILPWFGAGRSGEMSPAHGFARTSAWRLVEQSQDAAESRAVFSFESPADRDPNFPHPFTARYAVRLGATLHLDLTVENTGEAEFSFEEALHTYFHVGDVRKIRVEGLDGCSYLDQADPAGLVTRVQSGDLTFTGETDRIYHSAGQVRVIDPVLGRALIITKEHSANTVVWNPWIDKAQRMTDFGDDEWPSMLCIEGGNLRDAAVQLKPGHTHRMSYSVLVEPLN